MGVSNLPQLDISGRPALLNTLWKYQKEKGFISDDDVKECAMLLGMSKIEVEGVLSFYHFFSRKSRGEFTVYLNNSPVSAIRGYQRVHEAFEKETGSSFNDPDVTDLFGLFDTPCIGLSDHEPAALINYHPFTNLNSLKVRRVISALRKGAKVDDICDKVEDNIRYVPGGDRTIIFREHVPGVALKQLRGKSPDSVLSDIERSGLRGMGGAFFPTGFKWKACAAEPAAPKYVVCNADEGEPGTFKDRVLLNSRTGLLIEGMVIAGYAIGAATGIIYLRAEYRWLMQHIEEVMRKYRADGLLGRDAGGISGFNFDIRIQSGAGSYVCGEETALLNSLEGRRGEPRTKQYFPTSRGYLGQPTLVNNVETFCAAARILELGVDKYRSTGTPGSPGTKLISVSGDCKKPGVYEIEWGMRVGKLLDLCEADNPHFMQVSGPAGECISMEETERTLSMDDLKCGGSFMVFNKQRNLVDILINFADFFKSESCGVCTPCRAGNFLVRAKLDKLRRGLAREQDFDDIISWGKIMRDTSRCGLGKTATRSLCMAMDKFRSDFERSTDSDVVLYNRGFSLNDAIEQYEQFKS